MINDTPHNLWNDSVLTFSLSTLGLEPRTYGLKVRSPGPATTEPATTYDNPEKTLSPLLSLNPQNDPDLMAVLNAWPKLGNTARRTLAALATATVEAKRERLR
jgi:hypothetical protein